MKAAVLVLSDKGAKGERSDASGPALVAWLADRGAEVVRSVLIADEALQIEATLADWADSGNFDLIARRPPFRHRQPRRPPARSEFAGSSSRLHRTAVSP